MSRDAVDIAMEAWLAGECHKAELLLLAAAEAGNGHAAHNLGTLYATGGPGVPVDREKSVFWFERALESGFEATVSSDPAWFKKSK